MNINRLLKSVLFGMLFSIGTVQAFGIIGEPSVLYDCFESKLDVTYVAWEEVNDSKLLLLHGKRALKVILDSGRVQRLGYLTDNVRLACGKAEEMWDVKGYKRTSYYFLESKG